MFSSKAAEYIPGSSQVMSSSTISKSFFILQLVYLVLDPEAPSLFTNVPWGCKVIQKELIDVLQKCYRSVTEVIQRCYKGVKEVLQGC